MENKNGIQPSLSQYFANDPPSFFDELASNKGQTTMEAVGGGGGVGMFEF